MDAGVNAASPLFPDLRLASTSIARGTLTTQHPEIAHRGTPCVSFRERWPPALEGMLHRVNSVAPPRVGSFVRHAFDAATVWFVCGVGLRVGSRLGEKWWRPCDSRFLRRANLDLPPARFPQVLANTGFARIHADVHTHYDEGASFCLSGVYYLTSANEYYVILITVWLG
jgi:hypothetical protein